MNVTKHIEDLLSQYDCVIIPHLGGFITSPQEGFLDANSAVFHPPYKQILFNKNLTHNDGLLANRIVEKETKTFSEANVILQQYANGCIARLNNEGSIELERIGVLFFDIEKNIQFKQTTKNLLISSFGLAPKFLTPIPKEEHSPQLEPIKRLISEKINRKPVLKIKRKTKKQKKSIILPLLLIPVIAGGLFFANQMGYVGENKIKLSNLNPLNQPLLLFILLKQQINQVHSPLLRKQNYLPKAKKIHQKSTRPMCIKRKFYLF